MPETIEAEVLEIDGSPPPPPENRESSQRAKVPWDALRGKVIRLDRRWWPLWVLLGIVAVCLLLTVGLVVAVVLVIAKVIGGILRFLTGGGAGQSGSSLSRRGL